MTRQAIFAAATNRARLVLLIMLAVVASMTLHHGAMASAASSGHPAIEHHQPTPAENGAEASHTGSHGIPACCGMGLCLSGLPVAPLANVRLTPLDTPRGVCSGLDASWSAERIDRPPKFRERVRAK